MSLSTKIICNQRQKIFEKRAEYECTLQTDTSTVEIAKHTKIAERGTNKIQRSNAPGGQLRKEHMTGLTHQQQPTRKKPGNNEAPREVARGRGHGRRRRRRRGYRSQEMSAEKFTYVSSEVLFLF